MGFPWYSKIHEGEPINWDTVNQSFAKYFKRIGEEGCHVIWGEHELFVFTFEDMKFRNEDNWEVEGE